MIVVSKSNFDDEMYAEKKVCSVDDEFWATKIAVTLNKAEPEDSPNYYQVAPDDYELYHFEP